MSEIKVTIKDKKIAPSLKNQINFPVKEKRIKMSPKIIWLIVLIIFSLIFFFWLIIFLKIELKEVKKEDNFFKSLFQFFFEVKKSSQETFKKFQDVFKQKKGLTPQEIERMKEKIMDKINE